MSRPKTNGACHDSTEAHAESAGTVRSRRHRERKKQGIVVLRDTEVGPEMLDALVAHGWLFEEQKHDAAAVHDAVGSCLYQALNAGMKPSRAGTAYIPVAMDAVADALPWLNLRPGEQVTSESPFAPKPTQEAVSCRQI